MDTSLKEWAITYAENGFRIIPLKPRSKAGAISTNGLGWGAIASSDPLQIEKWWTDNPAYNIGLPMGPNNLMGLDDDSQGNWPPWFPQPMPTYKTVSPKNGFHHIFYAPEGGIKNGKKLCSVLTVRSDGYYFVAPPSIHPDTGTVYQCHRNIPIWKAEIAQCPDWIIEAPEWKEVASIGDKLPAGGRHQKLVDMGRAARGKGKDFQQIFSELKHYRDTKMVNPHEKSDLELRSIAKYFVDTVKPDDFVDDKVDLVDSFPDEIITPQGKVRRLGTIKNLQELLKRTGIVVRYNVMAKDQEILVPNTNFLIDNRDNASFAMVVDWCTKAGLPTRDLMGQLSVVADHNLYNPMMSWILSKPWDGSSRIEAFLATVQSETPMKNTLIKTWMLQCIAAAVEPEGISAGGMLVFSGRQYIGKSQWFKNLCPAELRSDGMTLIPSDKDSVLQNVSRWLVELGELDATFKKADIAQLKSFLTRDRDSLRPPYAKKKSDFVRKTSFFGSVNEDIFLNDPTGNRRFWVVSCSTINYDHGLDMQQIWAEFLCLYKQGYPRFLNFEEVQRLNEQNQAFEPIDPFEERIRKEYDWGSSIRIEKTATEVAMELDSGRTPDRGTLIRIGRAFKKISGLGSSHKNFARTLLVPPRNL